MKQQAAWWRAGTREQHAHLTDKYTTYSALREARDFAHQAMDSAARADLKEAAATYAARADLREALFGNLDEARRSAAMAMQRSTDQGVQFSAALAFAYTGDDKQAQALTADLTRFSKCTIVQANFLPTLRAKLALSKGEYSRALESTAATPYDLGRCGNYRVDRLVRRLRTR